MKLTPNQWRILASNGTITGYKCRAISQKFFDGAYWFCFGIITGLIIAVVINQIFRSIL